MVFIFRVSFVNYRHDLTSLGKVFHIDVNDYVRLNIGLKNEGA